MSDLTNIKEEGFIDNSFEFYDCHHKFKIIESEKCYEKAKDSISVWCYKCQCKIDYDFRAFEWCPEDIEENR